MQLAELQEMEILARLSCTPSWSADRKLPPLPQKRSAPLKSCRCPLIDLG
jgi:hypothetical protein